MRENTSYVEKVVAAEPFAPRAIKDSGRSSLSLTNKLEEIFLNHCRRKQIPVRVYQLDKKDLQGVIVGFDQHSMVLEEDDGRQVLLFKHAIIDIHPIERVDFLFHDHKDLGWRN